MVKIITYILFWNEFVHTNEILFIRELNNDQYKVNTVSIQNITEDLLLHSNVIICGSFNCEPHIQDLVRKYSYKTIVFITEPVQYVNNFIYSLSINRHCRATIGCINNDIDKVKYPLYNMYTGNSSNFANMINNSNAYINSLSFEDICNKNFCWLINSHDAGNTRVCIYNSLSQVDNITCPGKLLNNYSNEEFEKEGRENFQKRFIFGICSENYVTDLDGYVTEKLYYACIYGNIPIYYGKLDDIDKSIFNMNRVLVYNPHDSNSINDITNRVIELMSDKQKLFNFYKQKAFTENAIDVIRDMENNFLRRTKQIIDSM
jgi:hypothetical protein